MTQMLCSCCGSVVDFDCSSLNMDKETPIYKDGRLCGYIADDYGLVCEECIKKIRKIEFKKYIDKEFKEK